MTTTVKQTIGSALDVANPSVLADVLQQIKLARMLTPIKVIVSGLTGAAAFDITTATFKSKLSSNAGITLATGENLPAIQQVLGLVQVVAGGTTYVGCYAVAPAEATPVTAATSGVVGICTLSDDGKTITFPASAAVTGFEFWYLPIPKVAMTTVYPSGG